MSKCDFHIHRLALLALPRTRTTACIHDSHAQLMCEGSLSHASSAFQYLAALQHSGRMLPSYRFVMACVQAETMRAAFGAMTDSEHVLWAPDHGSAVILFEEPFTEFANLHVLCVDGSTAQVDRCARCAGLLKLQSTRIHAEGTCSYCAVCLSTGTARSLHWCPLQSYRCALTISCAMQWLRI